MYRRKLLRAGYARVDGVSLASDWADLTTCDPDTGDCLAALLILSEFNQPVTSNPWTNTRTDGTAGGATNVHCQNWTVGTNLFTGNTGLQIEMQAGLSSVSTPATGQPSSLYCFQQA
ncbi:MAG: hypothetical protein R2853_11040 [Thermomicrobiales bacterium]